MTWETVIKYLPDTGYKLLLGILILVAGSFIARHLWKLLEKSSGFLKQDDGVRTFLRSMFKVIYWAAVILAAANVIGIPMTSFITLLASAGVAIGLALQGALGNFVGGLMILIFHPFKVGDYIETGANEGTVREINVFYTRIVTYDNKYITLPNGSLTNSVIVNHFPEATRRQTFKLSVAYGSDTETVEMSIKRAIAMTSGVLPDPAPSVFMSGHGASSLDFDVLVWSKTEDYWTVYKAMYKNAEQCFREDGIEIPFPQMDVHMKG